MTEKIYSSSAFSILCSFPRVLFPPPPLSTFFARRSQQMELRIVATVPTEYTKRLVKWASEVITRLSQLITIFAFYPLRLAKSFAKERPCAE